MSSTPIYVALDVGVLDTKSAVDSAIPRLVKVPTPTAVSASSAPGGRLRAGVLAALKTVSKRADGICVALPDTWHSGTAQGAACLEELRHACCDELGFENITWTGQLAAAAAHAAKAGGIGRYLIGDIGGSGVRVGSVQVAGDMIQIEAAYEAEGGGWRDFDRSVRTVVGDDPLPETWYDEAKDQRDRAAQVLRNAVGSPDYADDRAYRLTGRREHRLSAGQLIDCFAPTAERITAGLSAALAAGEPDHVLLTGGLGWFPLACAAFEDVSGKEPADVGPKAIVHGAMRFARQEIRLAAPTGFGTVTMPLNRIHNGRLEEESLVLPWTEPFASPPGGTLDLDGTSVVLTIDGQSRTVRLPEPVAGPHRIGVRTGWSGAGVLVVRPASGGRAQVVALPAVSAPVNQHTGGQQVSPGGPETVLRELGHAVTAAAAAFSAMPAGDEMSAYRYVRAFDDALTPLADLLAAVSGVAELADAPAATGRLTGRQADLEAKRKDVARARATIEAMRAVEADASETSAEAQRLHNRVDEIERAQRLAAALPGLRARLRMLEAAICESEVAEASEVVAKLAQATAHLIALTEKQRDALGASTAKLIAEAQSMAAELEEQRALAAGAQLGLATKIEEIEQLKQQREQAIPALSAWHAADAELVGRLDGPAAGESSALEGVRAELANIDERLSALDDKLRMSLTEQTRTYNEARRIRRLYDRGGPGS